VTAVVEVDNDAVITKADCCALHQPSVCWGWGWVAGWVGGVGVGGVLFRLGWLNLDCSSL